MPTASRSRPSSPPCPRTWPRCRARSGSRCRNAMAAGVSRRKFLGGSAAAVLTTACGGVAAAGCSDDAAASQPPTTPENGREWFPFEAVHQHGVLTPPQENAIVVAFDSVAADRDELAAMF